MLNVNTIFISHALKPKPPFFQFGSGILLNILRVKGWPLFSSCIKNYHSPLVSIIYFKHSTIKKKKKNISCKGKKIIEQRVFVCRLLNLV